MSVKMTKQERAITQRFFDEVSDFMTWEQAQKCLNIAKDHHLERLGDLPSDKRIDQLAITELHESKEYRNLPIKEKIAALAGVRSGAKWFRDEHVLNQKSQ